MSQTSHTYMIIIIVNKITSWANKKQTQFLRKSKHYSLVKVAFVHRVASPGPNFLHFLSFVPLPYTLRWYPIFWAPCTLYCDQDPSEDDVKLTDWFDFLEGKWRSTRRYQCFVAVKILLIKSYVGFTLFYVTECEIWSGLNLLLFMKFLFFYQIS